MSIFSWVLFSFVKIMHKHFIFFLIDEQRLEDNGIKARTGPLEGVSEADRMLIIKYSNDEDDNCGACRWNHIWCINVCLAKSCRKDKSQRSHYNKYIREVYSVFEDELKMASENDVPKLRPPKGETIEDTLKETLMTGPPATVGATLED